jgi:Ankyrin repeats (3 copies)
MWALERTGPKSAPRRTSSSSRATNMSSRAGIAEVFEVSLLEVQLEHGQDPFPADSPWVAASKPPAFAIKPCELDCHLLLTELVEKHGIDANFQDAASGKTLLAVASANGSGKCVTVLLSHGADPNKPLRIRGGEWSPLHLAAQYGHTAICRQLLDFGASLDAVIFPLHFTPLHVAAVNVFASQVQRRGAILCERLHVH